MAQFSSPMDWEPTHRVDYKPAWQPPLSGRFVVVANERDRSEWRPQMPGAFVDTPPRRNEVGLQPRSRKRTAESAQFEDQPRYDDEPASAQPVAENNATMSPKTFFAVVCWFARITWASAKWTVQKARQIQEAQAVQVIEIRRAAADGYLSIKRRATEVVRPSAPTADEITHQRRAQNTSRQPTRNSRRSWQESVHVAASGQSQSRMPSRTEHTVSQTTTGAQPMAPLSPPPSPLAAATAIPNTRDAAMDQSARVDEIPTEDSFVEMMKEAERREEMRLKQLAIDEMNRPKSLDEMLAMERARQPQTHNEKAALKKSQELAQKKARMARAKAQQEAKKAEIWAEQMALTTAQQKARQAKLQAQPVEEPISPESSEQGAEDEGAISAYQSTQTIAQKQARQSETLAQQRAQPIFKLNYEEKAEDEPLAPVPVPPEDQKAQEDTYKDLFRLPEVYEEAKVLEEEEEVGVEGGLKNLALESSSEYVDWKTEEDKRRKKAFEDYTRMAAEQLAKAQAEAEKLAREIQVEEAAREPHTGRRRLQTKLVQLSEEWQTKVNQAMGKGPNVTLASTLDGTQLTKHDFDTVLGHCSWLNDNIINSYVDMVVEHANKKAGRNQRDKTPKVVAQSSFFYTKISQDGPQSVSRWMRRKRAAGKNLLEVETMLIPVNNASHWTMIVVCPKARTIEYLDSFGGTKDVFIRNTKAWLAAELGSAWKEDDWRVLSTKSARQHNGYDCGVFAITNAECVVGGVTTTSYDGDDMTMQRRRVAAVLLNGGFDEHLEAAEDM